MATAPSTSPAFFPAAFYDAFISEQSKARIPSAIRSLMPLELEPGIISLLAGKPNPETFPFTSISLTVRSPISTSDAPDETTIKIEGAKLEEALQYGPTIGLHSLVEWLTALQIKMHKRSKVEGEWSLSVGSGSQDLVYKAILALVNPGDPVLVESPVYAGVIPILRQQNAKCVELQTDGQGIITSHLASVLEQWPDDKPKPRLLYTVPYGCNPTGATTATERRREILDLAHKHNLLILEDDPYYYLYFGAAARPPSYFEIEASSPNPRGRVLRFDSFSKVLSSGLRIGFVTGPTRIVQAINIHTTSANLQCSSTGQAITYALLSHWGHDMFLEHTNRVAQFYRAKRDTFERSMNKHLKGLAEWTTPEAGLFFWFKLLLPPSVGAPEGDSDQLIRTKAFKAGVLALPGSAFFATGTVSPYVRTSFSLLGEEEVDEALRRLSAVLRSVSNPSA